VQQLRLYRFPRAVAVGELLLLVAPLRLLLAKLPPRLRRKRRRRKKRSVVRHSVLRIRELTPGMQEESDDDMGFGLFD
jgi:hypothetical protein